MFTDSQNNRWFGTTGIWAPFQWNPSQRSNGFCIRYSDPDKPFVDYPSGESYVQVELKLS